MARAEGKIGPVADRHFRQRCALRADVQGLQQRDGGPGYGRAGPAAADGPAAYFERVLLVVQRGVETQLDVAVRRRRLARRKAEAADAVDFVAEDLGQRPQPGIGGHDPRRGGYFQPATADFQGFWQRDEIEGLKRSPWRGRLACQTRSRPAARVTRNRTTAGKVKKQSGEEQESAVHAGKKHRLPRRAQARESQPRQPVTLHDQMVLTSSRNPIRVSPPHNRRDRDHARRQERQRARFGDRDRAGPARRRAGGQHGREEVSLIADNHVPTIGQRVAVLGDRARRLARWCCPRRCSFRSASGGRY